MRLQTRPVSIATRLACFYLAATAVLLLVAAAFLYVGLARSLRTQDEHLLASKIRVLRHLLVEEQNSQALESEIEHEAGEDQLLKYYLRVVGADGHALVETPRMAELLPLRLFTDADAPRATGTVREYRDATNGREFLLLVAWAHSFAPGGETRTLHIALDTSMNRIILGDYRRHVLAVFACGAAFAAIAGIVLTRAGLRPLRVMTGTIHRITASKLDERVLAPTWPAELRDLAGAFDGMLDRLEHSFNRLTEFSADIAHAMRNPINNLRGEIEVALTRPRSPAEYQQTLGSSLEELERLSRLIEGLLFIARADNPQAALERVEFPVREEMDAVREFYEALAAERQVVVFCSGEASLRGDPALVRRAISNLVANALKFTRAGGRVSLETRVLGDGSVEITAADTGCGIAEENLPKVFERFFQVDQPLPTRPRKIQFPSSL